MSLEILDSFSRLIHESRTFRLMSLAVSLELFSRLIGLMSLVSLELES